MFFGHLHAFLRRPWVFLRALGCGARRGPACTPRWKLGSQAGSVARALGVQSHEIWQVITGSLFRGASAEQDYRKPACQLFCSAAVKALYFVAATVYSSSRTSLLVCVDHYYARVDIVYVSVLCVLRYVCVSACGSAYFGCWNPTF